MTPGMKVRRFREARQWSPDDLAKACVMRPQFILQIEDGEAPHVHTRTWQKIADVLDVTLEDIFNEDEVAISEGNVIDEVSEENRPLVIFTLRLTFLLGALVLIASLVALCAALAALVAAHF